jgi:hypothetical protein
MGVNDTAGKRSLGRLQAKSGQCSFAGVLSRIIELWEMP